MRLVDIVGGAVTVFQTAASEPRERPVVAGRVHARRLEGRQGAHRAADRRPRARRERLGAGGAAQAQGVDAGALQAAYFRRYVDAWKAFLLSLSVKEPASIDEARGLLKTLVMRQAARRHLAQRQQGSGLQGRVAAAASVAGQGQGSLGIGWRTPRRSLRQDDDDAERPTRGARPGGRKPTNEDPTTPEDVGREFAAFLSFGLTKPTGLETYGQILAELQGAVGEPGAPDPQRVPDRDQDPAGEAGRT